MLLELLCFFIGDEYTVRLIVIGLIVATVAALILGLSMVDRLLQRLAEVSSVIERFEQGDFSERFTDPATDEIGELAAKCNRVADGIETTIDELERSERVRGDLISGISHDLKSPLNNLREYAGILSFADSDRKAQQIDVFVSMVSAEIEALGRLLQELSELAKLENHEWLPERQPFALEECIYEATRGLRAKADTREILLVQEQSEVVPHVVGDPAMIEQVLHYLIETAVLYTENVGAVSIDCNAEGEVVRISVASSGMGLPPSETAPLLKQFSGQALSFKDGLGPGGLGLAIVRRILELHGTTVELARKEGEGLTFHFTLPRISESERLAEVVVQTVPVELE